MQQVEERFATAVVRIAEDVEFVQDQLCLGVGDACRVKNLVDEFVANNVPNLRCKDRMVDDVPPRHVRCSIGAIPRKRDGRPRRADVLQ